jgi:3',5'-nucleoside bisphosphate phosphatase
VRIDLHTHSRVSDGTDSPAELVRAARAAGLDVVALTDHDTADGWPEAVDAAREAGIELVRGMEISTVHHGHAVHLLGYLPDPAYPPLADELDRILVGRTERLPRMIAKLNAIGIPVTVEQVHAISGEAAASGRPHVADALVQLGVVSDRTEAFDRFLGWGRPGYLSRYAAPLVGMIEMVAAAGGVTVIAHPWGRSGAQRPNEDDLVELVEAGLSGLEADHQDHGPDERRRLKDIAAGLDLVVTGSSDYHGSGKTDHDLGVNTTAPDQYARLLERAAQAATAARAAGLTPPEVVQAQRGSRGTPS